MSVQAYGHCYASLADAAPRACASFQPVSTVAGSTLVTVGCEKANSDGSLAMYRATADMSSSAAPVLTAFTQQLVFPDCVEAEYVQALEGIAGPALAVAAACWGLWRIYDYLGRGRADHVSS